MVAAFEVLQFAVAASLLSLGIVTLRLYLKNRESIHLYGCLAVCLLFGVSLAGRLDILLGYRFEWVRSAQAVLFTSSGFALLMLRHQLLPLRAPVRWAIATVCLISASIPIAVGLPGGRLPHLSVLQIASALQLVLVWGACVIESAVRFTIAGRTLPAVQRARLRFLSIGYAGLVFALLVGIGLLPDRRSLASAVILRVIALLMISMVYVSFAPPWWLRRIWREKEERALVLATRELVEFTHDESALASTSLDWAMRLVGANAGALCGANGRVLASRGLEILSDEFVSQIDETDGLSIVLPIQCSEGDGKMILLGGPFTPLFGSDELERVEQYAALIATALDRVRLSVSIAAKTELHEALIEAQSDLGEGVAIVEGEKLVFINDAICETYGYTRDELMSLPSILDLIVPSQRESIAARLAESFESNEPGANETAAFRKDGSVVDVEFRVKPLASSGRLIAIVRDISERKASERALKQSEERFRRAFEDAPVGMTITSLDGTYLQVNQAFCEIVGYTHDYLLSMNTHSITHEDDISASTTMTREMIESDQSKSVVEKRFRHKAGHYIWTQVSVSLIRDEENKPLHFICQVENITKRREAEEALKDSERKYAEAYERERQASEELRSLDELKDSFLTAVSHELRTPLTLVLGFAWTLQSRDSELTPTERRRFIDRLAAAADKLNRLLTDLMDLDRLTRGLSAPERLVTDVGDLVRRVVAELEVPSRKLEVDAESVVLGVDATQIERIVENLVINAFKYTPLDTSVWVKLRSQKNGALLIVEDSGPGVAHDLRSEIFEPFRRGGDHHSPGTGIGLSLVKQYAELHGGKAWVQERKGGGASFRVWLPFELELENATVHSTKNAGSPSTNSSSHPNPIRSI